MLHVIADLQQGNAENGSQVDLAPAADIVELDQAHMGVATCDQNILEQPSVGDVIARQGPCLAMLKSKELVSKNSDATASKGQVSMGSQITNASSAEIQQMTLPLEIAPSASAKVREVDIKAAFSRPNSGKIAFVEDLAVSNSFEMLSLGVESQKFPKMSSDI